MMMMMMMISNKGSYTTTVTLLPTWTKYTYIHFSQTKDLP